MFKLTQLRPEGSDCTAPYGVELNGEYTVAEFITDVLKDEREWGYIGIDDGKAIFGNPCREYKGGKMLSTLPDDFLTMKVTRARASGGWSRMDYLLKVEALNGPLVTVTTHYGFRKEDIYGDYKFVVYKLGEIGNSIASFKNQIAAIHECKYLERLFKDEPNTESESQYDISEEKEPLILEPEDWSSDEWVTLLKLFGMKKAERIKVSNYTLETFGVRKVRNK